MNKDAVTIGIFLVFIFIISMVAHMFYVKGYAVDYTRTKMNEARNMTVYGTQDECEKATGGDCALQLCDNIPPGKSFEDMCGEGFKKGWQPKAE